MPDSNIKNPADLGGVISNAFGEHSLFGVNREVFQTTDASTVFRNHFGKKLFEEDVFYIIAGTDSGLLYQYIKANSVPKGSHYLFIELPEILAQLNLTCDTEEDIAVVTNVDWLPQADDMEVKKYALMKRLVIIRSLGVIHGHYPGYYPFWRAIKQRFDSYVEDINNLTAIRPFIACQIENLTENQIPSLCLKNIFTGKTAVVLAGGPSLDDILPWVKQHRAHLLVIAVSRISRSLLSAEIQPDITVSVDPQDTNLHVCKEVLEFQDTTLLVNNYHLSPNLLACWGGDRVFIGPRYPWPTPLEPENFPPCGGTTVTNTSLDLAVLTGAAQIILAGVDFCFAQQGHTHASGTLEHKMGSMPQRCELQVVTNSGKLADTANGYLVSGRYIDKQAKEAIEHGCRVINPAPGALRLDHVEHVPLESIQIEPMDKPAYKTIKSCIPDSNHETLKQLYKEILGEIDNTLKDLAAIKILSSKALTYNRKLFSKNETGSGYHNKDKVEKIESQLIQKYSNTCGFIRAFGVRRFVPLLRLDDDKYVEDLEESCRLYHQAIVDTCDDLLELLRSARTRVIIRQEEEKSQPNITRLIEQWRRDKQTGRSIFWAKKHPDTVNNLPEKSLRLLHEFQNTFDQSVEALGKDYIEQLENKSKLETIIGRARELFRCKDYAAISRLLSSLQRHHNTEQARLYIPLIEGYIAELDNNSDSAIRAYESVTQGPVYLDVLARLFELYTRRENWNSALSTLERMTGISAAYRPMHADLLYATGDVDFAVNVYTDYILENPDDLNAVMKLGNIFLECDSKDGVIWTMNYILSKDPDNHHARKILDNINFKQLSEST